MLTMYVHANYYGFKSFVKKKKKGPNQWEKAPSQHVKPPQRRSLQGGVFIRAPCSWTSWRLCWTANWMKKWNGIFLFVFCVFVQCVLINMFNSNCEFLSSLTSIMEPRGFSNSKRGLLRVELHLLWGRLEADMATLERLAQSAWA